MTLKLDKLTEAAFATSELPIMVDIHDWHAIPESFHQIIATQYETIYTAA